MLLIYPVNDIKESIFLIGTNFCLAKVAIFFGFDKSNLNNLI
mgnify:FL=1